jgi:hypothetical protein
MIDLVNKRFNKLVVLSLAGSANNRKLWNCLCDCGNIVIFSTNKLKHAKSCGCLYIDNRKKIIKELHQKNIKYNPIIYNARIVWNSYKDISFEDFYKISQENCFYCNSKPFRKYNYFKNKKNSYAYNLENIDFIYNGLDRINSNDNHNINNVVPCCYICNRAKNDKELNDFICYVEALTNIKHIEFHIHRNEINNIKCDLNKKYLRAIVREVFRDKYYDADFSIEQFYKLSQLNCYYCGRKQMNLLKKDKPFEGYYYNGLDRINNNLGHFYTNVVNCCFRCNFAKSNISFDDFIIWINKLKNNYNSLINNCMSLNSKYDLYL